MRIFQNIVANYEKTCRGKNDRKGWDRWPERLSGGRTYTMHDDGKRDRVEDLKDVQLLLAQRIIGEKDVKWVTGYYGYDPQSVYYRYEKMEAFYRLCHQVPIWEKVAYQKQVLEEQINNAVTPWILACLQQEYDAVSHSKVYSAEEFKKREKVYRVLLALDKLEQTNTKQLHRAFSTHSLHGSKIFEKEIQGEIIKLARTYHPDVHPDKDAMSDADVLSQIHIQTYSQELTIKGSLRFWLKAPDGLENLRDTADYPYGMVLNQETLSHMTLCPDQNIRLIRCIENKANFVAEPYEEQKLVVFTHGYLSPGERVLLNKLRVLLEASGDAVRYEHSGDLDFGGINIYRNLREKVFPALQPRKMDLETYEICLQDGLTEPISPAMAEKIEKLSTDSQLGALAARLSADRMVVEQEAYL